MTATTSGIKFVHAEDTSLEVRVCPTCGITYAVPSRFIAGRLNDKKIWYCPNGHEVCFTQSEADRLKAKLETEQRSTAFWRDQTRRAEQRIEHEKARANGYKGALTKVKKRIGKGVCPACNRHFANVENHMAAKHPELADETADLEAGKPA